jgi:predicted MFS family arabinose efflux permease
MNESRDSSRTSRTDWTGASLAVLGFGGLVFGLIEWPKLDANRPILLATMTVGAALLVGLILVERRVEAPMVPPGLFRSRTFALANLLTLFLYGALTTVFWLVPLNLIQVQHYSATAAGAALLPFPLLLFLLSRWSGGLTASIGSRLPLTVGPIVAAIGFALYAWTGLGGSYWTTFFPAVMVLGLGMSIVVAPLTTTAMSAVDEQHAGVASGVNNAVARLAGLIAVAVFGIMLVRAFDARARPEISRLDLSSTAREAIERELPRLAGAEIPESIPDASRAAAREAIAEGFLSGFRVVMITAAILALAAAGAGVFIRDVQFK